MGNEDIHILKYIRLRPWRLLEFRAANTEAEYHEYLRLDSMDYGKAGKYIGIWVLLFSAAWGFTFGACRDHLSSEARFGFIVYELLGYSASCYIAIICLAVRKYWLRRRDRQLHCEEFNEDKIGWSKSKLPLGQFGEECCFLIIYSLFCACLVGANVSFRRDHLYLHIPTFFSCAQSVSAIRSILLNKTIWISARLTLAMTIIHAVALVSIVLYERKRFSPFGITAGLVMATLEAYLWWAFWSRLQWILYSRRVFLMSRLRERDRADVTTGIEILWNVLLDMEDVLSSNCDMRLMDFFHKIQLCRRMLVGSDMYSVLLKGEPKKVAAKFGILQGSDQLDQAAVMPKPPMRASSFATIRRASCLVIEPKSTMRNQFGKIWSVNLFGVQIETNGNALLEVGLTIAAPKLLELYMDRHDDVLEEDARQKKASSTFLHQATLSCCLRKIQEQYLDLPYHNSIHGAQVAHSFFCLVGELGLRHGRTWSPLLELSCCLSALAHDLGHPGLTNRFFMTSYDPIAVLYNDQSTLENYHCCLLFLTFERLNCNVFSPVKNEPFRKSREVMIRLILATDMQGHFEHITRFRMKADAIDPINNEEDLISALEMCIKAADLSSSALNWDLHLLWCYRVAEEFYRQGALESRLGLVPSPMCDRSAHLSEFGHSQSGFLTFVVLPLYREFRAFRNFGHVPVKCTARLASAKSILPGKQKELIERNSDLGLHRLQSQIPRSRRFTLQSNQFYSNKGEGEENEFLETIIQRLESNGRVWQFAHETVDKQLLQIPPDIKNLPLVDPISIQVFSKRWQNLVQAWDANDLRDVRKTSLLSDCSWHLDEGDNNTSENSTPVMKSYVRDAVRFEDVGESERLHTRVSAIFNYAKSNRRLSEGGGV